MAGQPGQPGLVLADEPTGNLDSAAGQRDGRIVADGAGDALSLDVILGGWRGLRARKLRTTLSCLPSSILAARATARTTFPAGSPA